MPNVAQLLNMDVNGLYNALVDWRTLTDALTTAQNSAAAKVGAPLRDSQWTGLAADKAYIGLNILADDLLYAASQARMISTVLTDMHGFFETMRNELRKLIDSAAGLYTVNDDGSVSYVEGFRAPERTKASSTTSRRRTPRAATRPRRSPGSCSRSPTRTRSSPTRSGC